MRCGILLAMVAMVVVADDSTKTPTTNTNTFIEPLPPAPPLPPLPQEPPPAPPLQEPNPPTTDVPDAKCQLQCPMSKHQRPICGSNGQTYANMCDLEMDRHCGNLKDLSVNSCGSCTDPVENTRCCPLECPDIDMPVCGTDGKDYPSPCKVDDARLCQNVDVYIDHYGPCDQTTKQSNDITIIIKPPAPPPIIEILTTAAPSELCPLECPVHYHPVCGSNEETYANMCELENDRLCGDQEDVYAQFFGLCSSPANVELTCQMDCPNICKPVCGTDGKEYQSPCKVDEARLCRNIQVHIKNYGPCLPPPPPPLPCPITCPMVFEPVCGSDGVTYPSVCELTLTACTTNQPVVAVSYGSCDPHCPLICSKHPEFRPVCGTDGRTYRNYCSLQLAKLCYNKALNLAHNGMCLFSRVNAEGETETGMHVSSESCRNWHAPVCGNDGKSYENVCELYLAKNKDKSLTLKHPGQCKESSEGSEDYDVEGGDESAKDEGATGGNDDSGAGDSTGDVSANNEGDSEGDKDDASGEGDEASGEGDGDDASGEGDKGDEASGEGDGDDASGESKGEGDEASKDDE